MVKRRFLLTGSALVLLAATSCTRTAYRSSINATRPSEGSQKKTELKTYELSTSGNDEEGDKEASWSDIVASIENSDDFEMILKNSRGRVAPEIAVKAFSETETQHVKFSSYDPFAGSDYLIYDLRDMQKGFRYPLNNGKLISTYGIRSGRMHTGIDLKAAKGDDVYAAFDGVVRMAKPYSGYGNCIVIRHYNGLETLYSHNSRNLVRSGQKVKAGDVIAQAGRTGRASTEHVHFEVRVQGQYFNPLLMVDVDNKSLQNATLYVYKKGSNILATNNRRKDGGDGREMSNGVLASVGETGIGSSSSSDDNIAVRGSSDALPPYATARGKDIPIAEAAAEKPIEKSGAASTKSTSGAAKSSGTSSETKYHTVVRGDTLSAIARKYGTKVSTLCKLNNMQETDKLQLKKKLKVK